MIGPPNTRTAAVERYLRDLSAALGGIRPDERADIVASVTDHIDSALDGIESPTPDDVQRVLDGLGDPMAIAASAARTESRRVPVPERTWVPAAAVLSLLLGGVLFFLVVPMVLWLAGLILLWVSPLWRVWEKALGTLLVAPLGYALVGSVFFPSGYVESCSSDSTGVVECTSSGPSWIAATLGIGAIAGAFAAAGYLWWAGTRRARERGNQFAYDLTTDGSTL